MQGNRCTFHILVLEAQLYVGELSQPVPCAPGVQSQQFTGRVQERQVTAKYKKRRRSTRIALKYTCLCAANDSELPPSADFEKGANTYAGANMLVQWNEIIRSKSLMACIGLLSHVFYMRGHHDNKGLRYLKIYSIAFMAMALVEYSTDKRVHTIFEALSVTMTAASVHFVAMTSSIMIYRGFFHRLAKVNNLTLAIN